MGRLDRTGYLIDYYKGAPTDDWVDVVKITGGKSGVAYFRVFNGKCWGWTRMCWMNVPSKEEQQTRWKYEPTIQDAAKHIPNKWKDIFLAEQIHKSQS